MNDQQFDEWVDKKAKKAEEIVYGLIGIALIILIPAAIIGIAWEEWTRDPELTALYERVDRERAEKKERDALNRYIFKENLRKDREKGIPQNW